MKTMKLICRSVSTFSVVLVCCVVFCVAASAVSGNDSSPNRAKHESTKHPLGERLSVEKTDLETPGMKSLRFDKKIGRRLPIGYKDVVTNQQRDEIYEIQQDYGQVIERLKMRLQLLERERDRKIDALLMDEQVDKLKKGKGTAFERHLAREEEKPAPRRARQPVKEAEEESEE